ncbi:MAG: transposase [Treponema succinifaciens]|nr:MAG: transposase [Treponema succinifaciens]
MLMIKITVWALPHTKWRHYMEIITQNEKILYIGILFYGFKPHGVCSEKGVLESVVFTSGNINDSKMVEKVTENMKGWFYCDAGYLKKCGGACQACKVRPLYMRRSQTEHEQDCLKRAMAPSQKTEHH